MIDYNNKRFKPINNTANGETSSETVFHYQQEANILRCSYSGGDILLGTLLALVGKNGSLDMRYQQINRKGELKTGICHSSPEILPNGKIRLHEKWQWTCGDYSEGESVLEEV